MKPLLRTLLLLTAVGYSYVINAQTGSCTVTDLLVQNIRPSGDDPCTFTFDVAFTMTSNSSKYVYLQSYIRTGADGGPGDSYPDYFDCVNGTTSERGTVDPPTFSDLNRIPFLNILIDNSGDDPVFATTYPADPTGLPIRGVVFTGTPSSVDTFRLANGDVRFNLYGLQAQVPAPLCVNGTVQPFVIVTDFFGTNANNPNVIQCVSCEVTFAAAFFSTQFVANCTSGDLTVTLTSNSSEAFSGTWQLFVDVNDNRLYTPGIDVPLNAAPIDFDLTGLSSTAVFSVVVPAQYRGYNVILITEIETGFGEGASSGMLLLTCGTGSAPLPVKFKAFNANRRNADVLLSWETASEDNNRGFYVQRNNGSGWSDLGFVASKALEGTSTGDLSYNYTDLNNTSKGVTQYRIRQVDIDGKAKLSEIRQVRGLAQAGKVTVYPNPSATGKVNVVFDDSKAIWNVSVADMNGRILKQFKGVTSSVLVDNLLPGMYMIRIVDTQTGVQTAEKVIINNH
ncbi:MAG TPA: T9SS type A sorting domain-containing protein [Chitinophagaceae bacterium]